MSTHRFSTVALACIAAFAVMPLQAYAQSKGSALPALTNANSLAPGMTTSAVRSYDAMTPTVGSGAPSNGKGPAPGNVGTTGTANSNSSNGPNGTNKGDANGTGNGGTTAGNNSSGNNPSAFNSGSSGTSTIAGTTNMANASTNQYSYNNGQLVNNSGGFMGPMQPAGSGSSGGTDWLKIVQVAAPVVASLTGNAKIGQLAGIAGSGAQIYDQVSSGKELTGQNYANMANIALQTAALASNNENLNKAATLGTVGVGAWNSYSAITPNTSSSAASQGPSWGAIGAIAASTAPQLGQVLGNPTIGQAGVALGNIANTYAKTNGFQSGPSLTEIVNNKMLVLSPAQSALAKANGDANQAAGSTSWWGGSGPAVNSGSISPVQMAADKAMVDRANATLDKALASDNSSWTAGQMSADGAAQANARGTPVDNSELQGQSYLTASQGVENTKNSGNSSWTAGQMSADGAAQAIARGTPADNSELQGQSYGAASPVPVVSNKVVVNPVKVQQRASVVDNSATATIATPAIDFTRVKVPTWEESFAAQISNNAAEIKAKQREQNALAIKQKELSAAAKRAVDMDIINQNASGHKWTPGQD